jgi:hypothetical protein
MASAGLASAIRYNRGRMYAAAADPTQRRSAIAELEAYLASASPAASWWPLAYDQYARLCEEHRVDVKTADQLRDVANTRYRLVTGVALPGGVSIGLQDSVSRLEDALGEGRQDVIVKRSNIRRLQYPELQMEVLCANHIVAIRLRGPNAPPMVLEASGPGGASHELRPGMTLGQLNEMLGGDADQWDQRHGTNATIVYRFYTRLGFGVRLDGDTITEIIVAQIPIKAKV